MRPDSRSHFDPAGSVRRDVITAGQPQHDKIPDAGGRCPPDRVTRDFEVIGFATWFLGGSGGSDGVIGSLKFTHPRASTSTGGQVKEPGR